MGKTFKIKIITPYGEYYAGDIEYLSIFSDAFLLGILPGHAPLVTSIKISKMSMTINNEKISYAIGGGVMHIKEDGSVTLMLDSIERYDQIDVVRAQKAKERAEERLKTLTDKNNIARAEASLRRALNRINVANNL